jgi:hypothetical protein
MRHLVNDLDGAEELNQERNQMKTYRIKDTESGKISRWSIPRIIKEINRDRSGDWIPYNKKDWEEGWLHFVEGECYELIGAKL